MNFIKLVTRTNRLPCGSSGSSTEAASFTFLEDVDVEGKQISAELDSWTDPVNRFP